MNLQTERIENHRAQLTIEIEENQLETAKQKAARQISQRVRIKGFRKGKAPYRLVAQYVGEAAILEEAVESLGDDLYKQALQESEVTPYGPGTFEDFKIEPAPTFVFSVPLQPEVDLNNYQDVRVDFEEPQVDEEDVEQALQQLRMRELEVLDAERKVAEVGNRVLIAVDSEFVDGEEPDDDEPEPVDDEETPSDDSADADGEPHQAAANKEDDMPYVPRKGDTFVHEENVAVILDPDEDPFMDGFVDAIVGAELGSDIVFELTIPDDDADITIVNRRVSFVVTLNQIESIRIPELDDAFAESVSKNRGDEVTDMARLRASIREDLETAALEQTKSDYSGEVLEQIVAGAEIRYPELMLEERVNEMINDFEGNLKRQNLSLKDYFRHTGDSLEALRLQYQEPATQSLNQSLVVMELIKEEEVTATDEQIDLRMELFLSDYGRSAEVRKLFDTPQMRSNLRSQLIIDQVNERLCAIGRGQDPDMAVESYNGRLRADVKLAQERHERLQGYLETLDSDISNEAESSEDNLEPDQEALPTSEAELTSTETAAAEEAEAEKIEKSGDVER
ncbi:MAG: trigger factor [Chloroflexi bacterium]|nr:trigger factor [Chloroflexota bacterium]